MPALDERGSLRGLRLTLFPMGECRFAPSHSMSLDNTRTEINKVEQIHFQTFGTFPFDNV